MRRMATFGLAGGLVALAHGAPPVAIPQQHISGGEALQTPVVRRSQSTTFGGFGGGLRGPETSQRTFGGELYSGTLREHPSDCETLHRHNNNCSPRVVIVPGYGYYGGYSYGTSATRDLADAEWAKVRLMEEELRLKEEQLKLEYEAKLAELDAKKEQMTRQDQKSSWDRAVAMYPPLLDPKSKMRVWYEHLLKQAREATDRWGKPIRVPELDAPDYPEIFAHRAAEQISLKPLPLTSQQPVQAAETSGTPAQPAPVAQSPISLGQEMPD
jgi:hypothetical protein